MRDIGDKLLSDDIFQTFANFIQQSTMAMSMTFLKLKYRKLQIELADTLFLKYRKERKPNVIMPFRKRLLLFWSSLDFSTPWNIIVVDSKLLLLLTTTTKEDKKYVNEDIQLNILCHPHCSCYNNLVMPLKAKYTAFLTLARLPCSSEWYCCWSQVIIVVVNCKLFKKNKEINLLKSSHLLLQWS